MLAEDSIPPRVHMDQQRRTQIGVTMAFIASILLAFNSIFAKYAYQTGIDPNTFTMLRLVVAALVLWGVFFLFGRQFIPIRRTVLWSCTLMAAANTIAQLSYYWGLTRLPAGVATLLLYLYPAVVILLLRLRGEPLTRRRMVRLAIALGGVALLIDPAGGSVQVSGVILVTVAVFTYALYLVLGQIVIHDVDPRTVALYVISIMAVMATGVRWVVGGSALPTTWAGWWPVLGVALLGTVATRLTMFTSIKYIGSTQTALIGVVEPLTTVLVAGVFLGEVMAPIQWLGGILIVVSLLLIDPPVVRPTPGSAPATTRQDNLTPGSPMPPTGQDHAGDSP